MKQRPSSERRSEQYSLAKILGLWALAVVPMGILSWIAFPLLAPDFESDPLGSGVTRVLLLTLGLIWLLSSPCQSSAVRKAICAGLRLSVGFGSMLRGSRQPANAAQGFGCGWYRSSLRSRWCKLYWPLA